MRTIRLGQSDTLADTSFAVACSSECGLSGLMQCLPLSCGSFPKTIGMIVDDEWLLSRDYVHGESIQVQCETGYAVRGASAACVKSFTIECREGEFRPADDALVPSNPRCEAVVCVDPPRADASCGEGSCPAFSSVFGTSEDKFLGVQLVTPQGRVSANSRQVPHSGVLVVTCLESMSANPNSLWPQAYSDCPTIPPQGGVAEFESGEYPAFCHDCNLTRQYYCATSRCSLEELTLPPNTVIQASDGADTEQSHLTYGSVLLVSCQPGYTFNQITNQPLTFEIRCQQNCQFSKPPPCVPKSCGTFALPAGTSVEGWRADREYLHGDVLSVVCLVSHRVPPLTLTAAECNPSYQVRCNDGELLRVGDADAGFQPCEHVECLDGAPCQVCETYSPGMGDMNVASWEPLTQRVHGETVRVRCKEGYRAALVDREASSYFNSNCSNTWDISIAPAASTSSCADDAGYEVTCSSTGWDAPRRCVPVVCPVSYAELFRDLTHSTGIESVAYGASYEQEVDPSSPGLADYVLLGQTIKVTCREGYRPGTRDRKARRWQFLTCQATCGFEPPAPCLLVECEEQEIPGNATVLSPRMSGGVAVPVQYFEDSFILRHLDSVTFVCERGFALEASAPSATSWRDASNFRNATLEWTPCKTVSIVTCWDGLLRGEQQCKPLTSECKTCAHGAAAQVIQAAEEARLPPVTQMYVPGIDLAIGLSEARIVRLRSQASQSGLALGDVIVSVNDEDIDRRDDVLAALQSSMRGHSILVGVSRPNVASKRFFLVVLDEAVAIIPPTPPAYIQHSIMLDGMLPYAEPYHSGDAVVVVCQKGYHAQSQNESEASCRAPSNYTMVCEEGSFRSSGTLGIRCTPHRCVPFTDWSLDANVQFAMPAAALLGEFVNVTCRPGFRPRPTGANHTRLLTAQDPNWFLAQCLPDCTYDAAHTCVPIVCPKPPNSRVIEHSQDLSHNSIVTVQCDFGLVAAEPQCTSGPVADESLGGSGCSSRRNDSSACLSALRVLCYDGRLNSSSDPCKPRLPCGCGTAPCSLGIDRLV